MIYFIQGEVTRNIKIGFTTNLFRRLNALQSSDKLKVLKVVTSLESDLIYHNRFKESWSHGEWFRPTTELMEYIASLPDNEYSGIQQKTSSPWKKYENNGRYSHGKTKKQSTWGQCSWSGVIKDYPE